MKNLLVFTVLFCAASVSLAKVQKPDLFDATVQVHAENKSGKWLTIQGEAASIIFNQMAEQGYEVSIDATRKIWRTEKVESEKATCRRTSGLREKAKFTLIRKPDEHYSCIIKTSNKS